MDYNNKKNTTALKVGIGTKNRLFCFREEASIY